jgi:hypothetical protein
MKNINIPLSDDEFEIYKKIKGNRTWNELISDVIKTDVEATDNPIKAYLKLKQLIEE